MTATLRIKKDRPNFYAVIRYVDASGKQREKWETSDIPVKGNNKRRAVKWKDEMLARHKQEGVDLSKNIPFVGFMAKWLENHRSAIEGSTYEGYRVIFDKHIIPYFEPKKLRVKDITPTHIQQYINHCLKTLSPNTVRKHLANLSKCMDSAIRQNIIAFNPVKRVDQPKKKKYTGAKFYNERQIEQLLTCSKGDPLEMVILLTVFYGLTRSEVLGIKWDAIDFENRTIALNHTVVQGHKTEYRKDSTKTDSRNVSVPLAEMIVSRLKQWKSLQNQHRLLQPNDYIDEGYVCTQADGSLIKPHYVSEHFKLLLARHNMPHIRFHDLRHSSAAYLKHLGFDLKDIQTWLRHGDISTTMNIYVNLDMAAKRNIADNLNQRFQNFGS